MSSRRDLLRSSAAILASWCAGRLRASPSSVGLKLSLELELPQSTVKALSSDGANLCVEDWAEGGYPLRVIQIGTWRTEYSGRFESRTLGASFFADSRSLFVQFLSSSGKGVCGVGEGNCAHQGAVVDFRTGERSQRPLLTDLNSHEDYWALRDGILLTSYYKGKPDNRTETLGLVQFSSLRRGAEVPYATQLREPKRRKGTLDLSNDFGFCISDDRRTVAYSFDHILLCRRTDDLSVLWTRTVEPQLNAYRVAVAAGGGHVAAAVAGESVTSTEQRTSYISVYDGRTGEDVARLPHSGTEGVALSPDGKLISIVAKEPGNRGEVVPTIHVLEVSSGRKLTSVAHRPVKAGKRQFAETACTVAFTSDSRYMITSGMATKIWGIAEA